MPFRCLLVILISAAVNSIANSQIDPFVFQINDFKATESSVNLEGSATMMADRIRLTPEKINQTAACWFKEKQIDFTHGFETEFTFQITRSDASKPEGDGFAFVIQNQTADVMGGGGDNIGYKGIPYAVALEFDTKDDNEGSRNHVNLSYFNPENRTYRRYATVHEIPEITDGKPHFTRILYQDGRLQVFLDSYLFPVLSVKLDVAEKIMSPSKKAWLGFTAATSNVYSNHDLMAWSIQELAPPPEINTLKVSVVEKGTLEVKNRKILISVWDPNTIDGDTISLKFGENWILTDYRLESKRKEILCTLTGFNQELVLYAHNVGMVPPNTVMMTVFDGNTTHKVGLESNMESTESIRIAYTGDE